MTRRVKSAPHLYEGLTPSEKGRLGAQVRWQRDKRSAIDRFLDKVDVDLTTGCWNWTAFKNDRGYGRFARTAAHRWAYTHYVGPIPAGLTIDHLCRNRGCVNPDHLEAVTHRENVLRGFGPTAINAGKTHCKRGHEFTPANTIKRPDGRQCRACHSVDVANYHQRLRRQAV